MDFGDLSGNSENLGKLLEGNNLIPVRVVDIILDDSSPEFLKYGGWNALGVIKYKEINSIISEDNPEVLNAAYPLFPNTKLYPLKNEIVFIIRMPDPGTQFKTSSNAVYYISVVNLWNSNHHNALPDITNKQNIPDDQKLDYVSINDGGLVRRSGEIKDPNKEISLGKTFKEKSNIHPVLPYEGDYILEGRFGQSIRLGSTVKNAKYKSRIS